MKPNVISVAVYLKRWHCIIGRRTILHYSNNHVFAYDEKRKVWFNPAKAEK
jgi:hypothetical protein